MHNRIRTLVIDDSPGVRAILSRFLRLINLTDYDTADNGRNGVAKAFGMKPDVVILDDHMPEMDGMETMSAIRSFLPGAVMVISSAFDNEEEIQRFRNAGADLCLPKPFDKEALATILAQAAVLMEIRLYRMN